MDLMELLAPICRPIPKVYPSFIMHRIRKGLAGPCPEGIIANVGELRTIGDCRYALTVTDTEGNSYSVVVSVVAPRSDAVAA